MSSPNWTYPEDSPLSAHDDGLRSAFALPEEDVYRSVQVAAAVGPSSSFEALGESRRLEFLLDEDHYGAAAKELRAPESAEEEDSRRVADLPAFFSHRTSFSVNAAAGEVARAMAEALPLCGVAVASQSPSEYGADFVHRGGSGRVTVFRAPEGGLVVEVHRLAGCAVAFQRLFERVRRETLVQLGDIAELSRAEARDEQAREARMPQGAGCEAGLEPPSFACC